MRAVLQRVKHAKVTIDGRVSGEIGTGFLILLGVAPEDTPEEALYLAKKCLNSIDKDIYATNDKTYNLLDGACFVICNYEGE